MATQAAAPTDFVSAETSKLTMTSTTVEEITISDDELQTVDIKGDICKLPVEPTFKSQKPTLLKEFPCEYPSVEANVFRTRDPLPFPDKLHDLISWTDAFVDRIAVMTQAQEEKTSLEVVDLNKLITKLRASLETTECDLAKSRDDTKSARDGRNKAEKALAALEAESTARAKTIDDLKKAALKQVEVETGLKKQIDTLTERLSSADKINKAQAAAFAKANKEASDRFQKEHEYHEEDHDTIKLLRGQLKDEQNNSKCIARDLVAAQADLKTAKSELAAKEKTNKDLVKDKGELNTKVNNLEKSQSDLKQKVTSLNNQLTQTTTNFNAAKKSIDGLNARIVTLNKQIAGHTKDLQTANASIKSLEKTKTDLIKERDAGKATIKTLEADLAAAKDDNKKLTSDLQAANTDLESHRNKLSELKTTSDNLNEYLKKALQEKGDAVTDKNNAMTAKETAEKSLAHVTKEMNAAIKKRNDAIEEKDDAVKARNRAEKAQRVAEESLAEEQESHGDKDGSTRAVKGKDNPEKAEKLKAAKATIQELQGKLITALDDSKSQAKQIADAEAKLKDLQANLSAAEKRAIPNKDNKSINILSVEYGGKQYTPTDDPEVFKKLYAAAEKKTSFKVDNDFFIHDPWHRVTKSCSITYQRSEGGAPIHLVAKERGTLSFN